MRFVVEGIGTPAPVAPTERLVVGGLYRYVRNPMYLAVAATIVGQALALGQPILLAYAAVFAVAVATFVHCTRSRPCAASSAGSTTRIGKRYRPGGRGARRGRGAASTTSNVFHSAAAVRHETAISGTLVPTDKRRLQ